MKLKHNVLALLATLALTLFASAPATVQAQVLGTNTITNSNLIRAAAYTVKGNATSAAANVADTAFPLVNAIGSAGTTFTIASGCGTPTSLTGGPTAGTFTSTTTSCDPVITLPTAPHGWACYAADITSAHAVVFTQTGSSTTSCTVSGTITSGDTVSFMAFAY